MKFYFVSKECFHNKVLHPRVPDTIAREENYWTERICVSPSINGCLTATAGRYKKGDELFIHVCKTNEFYQPTLDEVPDCIYTGECWIQHSVEMKFYSWIKITDIYPLNLHDFLSEAISFEILGVDRDGVLD